MTNQEMEMQNLQTQLKEWGIQIELLSLKHKTATEVALKFAQELTMLRGRHKAAAQKLQHLQEHNNGSYMWENIGDGG
ncbi:hypothetical protein MCAMS1_00989 [biofilm metagenome]